jgi:putative ABC transport system permease protein
MLFARAELGRSKLRFGLLTLGAGLLVFVLLFQQLLLGTVLDGMTGAIEHQSAPVLVLSRQAQRSVTGSQVLEDQLAAVAATPGVADAAELAVTMLSFQGEDEPEDEWREVAVFGYRPGRAGEPNNLRSGRLPEASNEVVVSAEDAVGRFGVGDTVTIEPSAMQLTVVGLTEGSRYTVSPTLWVPWPTYEVLAVGAMPELGGVVLPSAAAVQPEDGADPDELVTTLNEAFPELEALTREVAVDTAPGRESVRLAFMVVIGLGYLVVAVVIGFFFLTLTVQKEPAITLLRAVGSPQGYLVRGLLLQVVVVSLGGLVIGVALAYGAAPLLRSTVPVTIEPRALGLSALSALGVALLGAVSPIRRVLRADPSSVVSRPSLGGLG